MSLPTDELAKRRTVMLRNLDAISKKVPAALEKEQRGLLREVQRRQYAADPVKAMGLLYGYLDRVTRYMSGNIACKRGCNWCCHGEIALWQPEADYIAAKTGIPANQLPLQLRRTSTAYTATHQPCPFLQDGACSVYAHRPLACRMTVNLDVDDTVCRFEHRDDTNVPLVDRATTFKGVFSAFQVIVERNGGGAGDIREFFGEKPTVT